MPIPLLVLLVLFAVSPVMGQPLRVVTFGGEGESGTYFMRDLEGNPDGLEYKILEYFATAEGRPLEIIWKDSFGELFPTIESGAADIAAGTITVTPDREERMGFSASYLPVRVILVEPRQRSTTETAGLTGLTVATRRNTHPDAVLTAAVASVPDVEIVYPEAGPIGLFDRLSSGEIDAFVTESSYVFPYLEKYPNAHVTLTLGEERHFGFAVRKGSPLKEALSEHIARLKQSGIYFRLLEQYLGSAAVQVVNAGRNP